MRNGNRASLNLTVVGKGSEILFLQSVLVEGMDSKLF
nr:hypothetical protein [Clostridium estertheticum]